MPIKIHKTNILNTSQSQKLKTFGLDNTIIELIQTKDKDGLKNLLNNYPGTTKAKGDVFENVMAYLYHYNGYLVKVMGRTHDKGADILLYHPNEINNVQTVIQCKNHQIALNDDLIGTEISKFMQKARAFYHASYFTLVSVNGFCKAAHERKQFNISLLDWNDIEALIDSAGTVPLSVPKMMLKPHNEEAYELLCKDLKRYNKASIVHATGTGKSYIIAQYIMNHIQQKGLLVVPSKFIRTQFKEKFGYIMQDVQIITYITLMKMTEKKLQDAEFEYIIFDEFHRCGAKEWGKGVENAIRLNVPILGTTATHQRPDGLNMVKLLFDGRISSELLLEDAIARGIVKAPIYVASLYSLDHEVTTLRNDITKSVLNEKKKSNLLQELDHVRIQWEQSSGISTILKRYLDGQKQQRIIIFCGNIKRLEKMVGSIYNWFNEAFNQLPEVNILHSKQSNLEQDTSKKQFLCSKKHVSVLLSVDMLNEGVHMPGVTACVFLRKTKSNIIFMQQMGRAIDANNDYQPIIFDFVNNFLSAQTTEATSFLERVKIAQEKESRKRKSFGIPKIAQQFEIYDHVTDMEEVLAHIRSKGFCKGSDFLVFEEAREFIRGKGFKNQEEYKAWSKTDQPHNIPATPDEVYKDQGWVSWPDFLGTDFLPFEEAREFIHEKEFKNQGEYQAWSRTDRPHNIPSNPDQVYKKKGWVSWPDFLGTNIGFVKGNFLPFEEAREFIHEKGFETKEQFQAWSKTDRPHNIPSSPATVYKNKGWISWPDFLGTKIGFVSKGK